MYPRCWHRPPWGALCLWQVWPGPGRRGRGVALWTPPPRRWHGWGLVDILLWEFPSTMVGSESSHKHSSSFLFLNTGRKITLLQVGGKIKTTYLLWSYANTKVAIRIQSNLMSEPTFRAQAGKNLYYINSHFPSLLAVLIKVHQNP